MYYGVYKSFVHALWKYKSYWCTVEMLKNNNLWFVKINIYICVYIYVYNHSHKITIITITVKLVYKHIIFVKTNKILNLTQYLKYTCLD